MSEQPILSPLLPALLALLQRLSLISHSAILLTFWHLAFATLATQVLAQTTSLLDGRHELSMTPTLYLRSIFPIGLAYSSALVCSNMAYLYLSVAFIQMLKASAPVVVLALMWLWGLASPARLEVLNILLIAFGVVLASVGEIHLSLVGLLIQMAGVVAESIRTVWLQILLRGKGVKIDALVALYYCAPTCAVLNLILASSEEVPRLSWRDFANVGWPMFVLSALLAFILNATSVFLVSGLLPLPL